MLWEKFRKILSSRIVSRGRVYRLCKIGLIRRCCINKMDGSIRKGLKILGF